MIRRAELLDRRGAPRQPIDEVLGFEEIDQTDAALVGGKGANLGELSRVDGIEVPGGFCVTTRAYERVLGALPSIEDRLERLSRLKAEDTEAIRELSAEIRGTIEAIVIPDDLAAAITARLVRLGEQTAFAVRSSATAEDSPSASSAGQQDTFLNVVGPVAILRDISRCWASLFTERAVTYRLRNHLDHRLVRMAVVVQRMVFPDAAGILFTADPVTGNRKVASVEATFGLGEALVSGVVNGDVYKVRDDQVVATTVATKRLAICATAAGGTERRVVEPGRQEQPALTPEQVVRLTRLGRRIEAHFGRPQDIEWCLVDDAFRIVQSRPITTLFPVPASTDGENHVYVSVGHGQMMTDPMKPLGISLFQLTAGRPMHEAGGRLYVDVTRELTSAATRAGLLEVMGRGDPLIGDALRTLLDRGDFLRSLSEQNRSGAPAGSETTRAASAGESGAPAAPVAEAAPAAPAASAAPAQIETDPSIVDALIARSRASIAALEREIRTKSGSQLLDFILADIQELKRILLDPTSRQVIMAGMEATWWLNERLEAWLGEKNAADTLSQSVPNNVTAEMGLALLDVADVIRPHSEIVSFLEEVKDDSFLDALPGLPGGGAARAAIRGYLDKYGMRCAGEIDITRPRWSERPTTLLPLLLDHVRQFEPGEARRRFEQGQRAALHKEQDVLERLRALPDGTSKAQAVKGMIDRVRTFAGYREYPKYVIVSRYFIYKQALLEAAGGLVEAEVLAEREDIFWLTLHELQDVVRTGRADPELIRERRAAFQWYSTLTPPRVLTSSGEVISGAYRRDGLPAGALVGLPVSAGTVEGRARVILDIAHADLEPGDILVTAYTDPSWTPLFVAIRGLVTEVGGLMTHGAVIAREYGLPAVVGVEDATRLIRDRQRIRVHGTDGYVEILP